MSSAATWIAGAIVTLIGILVLGVAKGMSMFFKGQAPLQVQHTVSGLPQPMEVVLVDKSGQPTTATNSVLSTAPKGVVREHWSDSAHPYPNASCCDDCAAKSKGD